MKTMAEKIAEMHPARQQLIRERADALIAEELTLRQLRELLGLTQDEMADRLEVGQESVSRFERREDVRLSTLRSYVEALGGELHVTASFPDRAPVELTSPAPHLPRSAQG